MRRQKYRLTTPSNKQQVVVRLISVLVSTGIADVVILEAVCGKNGENPLIRPITAVATCY